MKVKIKSFDVEMEIKNKGIELDIYRPDGKDRLGDMVVTKTGLTWCKGQTKVANGKKVTWEKLIKWIDENN